MIDDLVDAVGEVLLAAALHLDDGEEQALAGGVEDEVVGARARRDQRVRLEVNVVDQADAGGGVLGDVDVKADAALGRDGARGLYALDEQALEEVAIPGGGWPSARLTCCACHARGRRGR